MVAGEGALLGGRYRLGEKLAAGGMGSIHSATDEKLGRGVAVKLLRAELAGDPVFVERFRREARAAAALSHPNVAAVFDFGEDEAGAPFIIMEAVDGRDLARILREEGPLPPETAAEIGAQIASALAHAHSAGVIHRDVKPANVMVTPGQRVKVTDFGIARAVGDSTLTATGSVLGTAHYLSPEQAGGSPAGPRSDIYSLGIVLYEMLTGSLPFTGESAVAVAMRHLSDEVPRPSDLREDVPAEFDTIVSIATAKDPTDRYASAEEMAKALRSWGDTELLPVQGTATTSVLKPIYGDRWDPRKIGTVVLIVLGVLGLLAATLLIARATGGQDDAKRERRKANAAERSERAGSPSPSVTEPEEDGPIMEDVLGFDYKEVKKEIEDLGYEVEVVFDDDSEFERDTIISTDPPEGSSLTEGQTITLYVSHSKGHSDKDEDED